MTKEMKRMIWFALWFGFFSGALFTCGVIMTFGMWELIK